MKKLLIYLNIKLNINAKSWSSSKPNIKYNKALIRGIYAIIAPIIGRTNNTNKIAIIIPSINAGIFFKSCPPGIISIIKFNNASIINIKYWYNGILKITFIGFKTSPSNWVALIITPNIFLVITCIAALINFNNWSNIYFFIKPKIILPTAPIILNIVLNTNLSKFNKVEMEFQTIQPDDEEITQFAYKYDMHIMEERYNVLIFYSGNAGLMYAR